MELLRNCRKLAEFVYNYSFGNIQEESFKLMVKIDKYIEDETLYK